MDRLRAGWPRFKSHHGHIFLFMTSGLALKPTQPPIQWVWGVFSPGVKRPGREADHSPPSPVEIKNDEAVPLLPHMSSLPSA